MAFSASKVPDGSVLTKRVGKNTPQSKPFPTSQRFERRRLRNAPLLMAKLSFPNESLGRIHGKTAGFTVSRGSSMICLSARTQNSEATESAKTYADSADVSGGNYCCNDVFPWKNFISTLPHFCTYQSRLVPSIVPFQRKLVHLFKLFDLVSAQIEEEKVVHPVMPAKTIHSSQALAEACKYASNDIILLSRGIMRLDARARQDVAMLGSGFLKLDARAREDTEKIDRDVKEKAERLRHIATILKNKAQSRLKNAADKHWSDGALEADLRRADFRAKQRAMEDALMALEFMKNIHDMMVSRVYKFPLRWEKGSLSANDIMLEKNGKTMDFFNGEVSTDRINAIQEAYWSIASALSEADGIDYTDPEELELLIATLIDLDAMDGKSSVSLLAECSSSPDVSTRQAVANALAAAPSMWTLGNAGMGALQRLAVDSNPAIARAASKAIYELKKQWEIEEGDSWQFTMNLKQVEETNGEGDEDKN
ncbi:Armadillo-like helical [Corchorus olitorius]|uniref:Armadillo-like helical n=1 Tax=Corchorus olitorius TaxID=93759 RepID=A0A1R3K9W6_9ROSI|nr:Armadillo-like helical [Corchorus olitorius]